MVLGEITTNAKVDYVQVVKNTLKTIGYEDEENGITMYITYLSKCATVYIIILISN